MGKVLAVPILLTKRSESYCVALCAKMIMEFHGQCYPLREIIAGTRIRRDGGTIWDMGIFFLEKNYEAQIIGWPHYLFPNQMYNIGKEAARSKLIRWCKRSDIADEGSRRERRLILEFLEAGGAVNPRSVMIEDIRDELSQGFPPVLHMNAAALYRYKRRKDVGHVMVLTGITGRYMILNDPNVGQFKCPTGLLMHACHMGFSAGLFVRPK